MTFEDVLEEIRVKLEERIRKQLSGLQGFVLKPLYNSTMPLCVQLSLAPEIFEFLFHEDGIVKLSRGSGSNPDVRIESDLQTFMSLFQNPSAKLFNELERGSRIRITSITKKGSDAEGYIRRYLTG